MILHELFRVVSRFPRYISIHVISRKNDYLWDSAYSVHGFRDLSEDQTATTQQIWPESLLPPLLGTPLPYFDLMREGGGRGGTLLEKQSKFLRYNMKCRGKRDTTLKIPRSIRFSRNISCYIAESRLPLGQCSSLGGYNIVNTWECS